MVVWCAGPPILTVLFHEVLWLGRMDDRWILLFLLSPATIVPVAEFHGWREFPVPAGFVVIINFVLYGGCLLVFRFLCLSTADRFLGRV